MNIVSYLVLLTVLLVVLCVIGILAVTFRSCVIFCCCKNTSPEAESETTDQTSGGHRNRGFDAQEEVRRVVQRPFNTMEQTECPPTYEEAVQQELFRFRLPPTPAQRSPESSNVTVNADSIEPPSLPSTSSAESQPTEEQPSSPNSQRHRQPRSRSSTANSSGLSTIDEEDDEWPVQVVIDCIGIQAARLIDNCDTAVHLTNGSELKNNSNC